MSENLSGLKINVRGIIQGVGFRPYIYNLAQKNGLSGWVRNTSNGVDIEINGTQENLDEFLNTLSTKYPPLAHIDEIITQPCAPNGYKQFEILHSQSLAGQFLPVSPDMSICPDCESELFDATDRRYRYPFINCTNCGPRFTIISDIPYDRHNTTMSMFNMCEHCHDEYIDPKNRRFHAQPIACHDCGPEVWFQTNDKILGRKEDAIQIAREWIRKGKILAVKGLGGYHLVCNAENFSAVNELRYRKKRNKKPFALMAFDIGVVEKHCYVSEGERKMLLSAQKPIVILKRKPDSTIAYETTPNQQTIGFMLPYTPLHLLLTEKENDFPEVFVMTSANICEEPIVYRDEEAFSRLNQLADAYLLHNRLIHTRIDDSVVREANRKINIIRRARGYAPEPVRLLKENKNILALGAELKNTFCMTREKYAFISHYIGDLDNYETFQSYESSIDHYEKLFHFTPEILTCDMHPDYMSTRYAEDRSNRDNLPLLKIQHHHAHLASCLAENEWNTDNDQVIGLCLDGTGYGSDGAIWGGEILLGDYKNFRRLYHLDYTPMPGGDASIKKPARMALAYLWKAGIDWEDDLAPVKFFDKQEINIVQHQIEKKINSPLTSSMGRLFDGISSLIGICQNVSYEGEAAIELEAICDPHEAGFYDLNFDNQVIDPAPMLRQIIHDIRSNIPPSVMAAKFHNTMSDMLLQKCVMIRSQNPSNTVALSGGVWQNKLLLENTVISLEKAGFNILLHSKVPPNDSGISLGQALIASSVFT